MDDEKHPAVDAMDKRFAKHNERLLGELKVKAEDLSRREQAIRDGLRCPQCGGDLRMVFIRSESGAEPVYSSGVRFEFTSDGFQAFWRGVEGLAGFVRARPDSLDSEWECSGGCYIRIKGNLTEKAWKWLLSQLEKPPSP